MKEKRSNMYIQ